MGYSPFFSHIFGTPLHQSRQYSGEAADGLRVAQLGLTATTVLLARANGILWLH